MAKTYNKMLMDVNGKIGNIVTEVQGDQNSRYLDIYLFNNGIPIDLTGHTVRIYMRRPNTNPLEEFFNDGEITEATRGRCQFLLSTQALAKVGELEAQVSIWNGTEEILSTQVFKIMVTTNLRTNGSIEASNEYGALVVLFQNLYEAHDLMTTMVQSFGESGETAASVPATTFWQMLEAVYRVNADALANASVQGVLDLIGATADTGGSETAGTVMAKENAGLRLLNRIKTLTGFYAADFKKENIINFDNINLTATTLAHNTSKKIASFVCKKSGAILISCSGYVTRSSNTTYGGGDSSGICYCINSIDLAGLDVGTVYAKGNHSDFNLIGTGVRGTDSGVTGGDVLVHVNAGEVLDLFINGSTSSSNPTTAAHKNLICTMYAFDF